MITWKTKGSFKNIEKFFEGARRLKIRNILDRYGKIGVTELSKSTPIDTGKTAESWNYRITIDTWGANVIWFNTNVNNGVSIAILIQYGHGTKNGGYVQPYDYINPAMKSIFDNMADEIWKEVSSL